MLGLDLDTPLTEDETRTMVDAIAEKIVSRRLEGPAVLMLEIHKPLSFIASQGLVCALPMIGPLVGAERIAGLSRLLRDRGNIDSLISRIEELSALRDIPTPEPVEEQS